MSLVFPAMPRRCRSKKRGRSNKRYIRLHLLTPTLRGSSGAYSEPYRLYNSDVFEYEMDSPMTLYGAIPFMQAHRKDSTVGIFWLNAAETWVDIVKAKPSSNPLSLKSESRDTKTHWFSESGVLDMFIFLGPTPKDVISSYTELTGYTQLPQQFAIAYHQCRWNYVSDEDVKDVDRKFDKHQIPYDIIWLDIEYTEGKKYFTWDPDTFPNPIDMQKQLDAHDRKLVAIIDPHIKNEGGYNIVDELKSKDLAVKNKDSNIYEGWCWPGSSHWIDCFNPAAIDWWKGLFSYKSFIGSASNTFIWNDMNEPSVFNGPETTMPKDNLHFGNWEHRDVHNVNGMSFMNATYEALLHRDKSPRRPFVLTRSFYSGTQRLGAMWTGDNQAEWSHLAASFPMVLSMNIAGFPFAGADVGGFFNNPSKELLTRWYQTGIWNPFFRAHAHIDTRRREPYLAGEPYTSIITQAIRLRYQLLPAWYTAFHEASNNGAPIVRPHYYVHPSDEKGFAIDDQLYLGSTGILTKPVTSEGATHVDIYIPDAENYYDYFDYTILSGAGKAHRVEAALDKIPVFIQGGHIIPRKDRARRSSGLMRFDPYTLVVVLDQAGDATGTLYVDDGESFDYQEGAYIHRRFTYSSAKQMLESSDLGTSGKKTKEYLKVMAKVRIEKIIIVNAPDAWSGKTEALVSETGAVYAKRPRVEFHAKEGGKAAWAVVKNPGMSVGADWSVSFA
jgi:alpha 1,3-glucosidase